jgi:hypothetical protein
MADATLRQHGVQFSAQFDVIEQPERQKQGVMGLF